MDLTSENVQAVLLDSLALDGESSTARRVQGIFNQFLLSPARLENHTATIRAFLGQVSTWFYKDRGGGHVSLALCIRRDGVRWGERHDAERLAVLGLGLGLIEFCLDRNKWPLFPAGVPYVRLRSDLFKLWATFWRTGPRATSPIERLVLPFDPDLHRAPRHIIEAHWFSPVTLTIAELSANPRHVADAFYNRIIIDGFFDDRLPSWILEPEATLQVY